MTFELAIATMHKTKEQCLKMLQTENIHCDCLIVNQCDIDDYNEEKINGQNIRIIFSKDRSLSKSRNLALRNMQADIMAIGDDDLYYYDNFDKTILAYYEDNPKADLAIFNIDNYEKSYSQTSKKCGQIELSGYISMQVTFTKKFIQSSDVHFNEFFGTGSGYFSNGEECIFLADSYRAGAKIFYCANKILNRPKEESSWFSGFNNEPYIMSKGAVYYAMSSRLFLLYIIRFSLKRKILKPFGILESIRLMLKGRKKYITLQNTCATMH